MASLIGYRKEFEDVILNGKVDEALNTLVPNSAEKIYLQFIDEYKKCFSEKKITPELNKILENAKSLRLSNKLIQVLETRRDLLEYDLPSTQQEKKNQIIDELYKNYCKANLNFDPPYFVREKKTQKETEGKEMNNTPLLLTEKMILEAVQNDIKKNQRDKKFRIKNAPEKNVTKYFWKFLKKIMIYVWI